MMRLHLVPELGNMAFEDIRPVHIINCLQKIADAGKTTTVNNACRQVKKIFAYVRLLGEIEINPAAEITQDVVGHSEVPRARKLSLSEILWAPTSVMLQV